MPGNRKLNRPSDQRNAVLRGLCTALIANGRIETTEEIGRASCRERV